ncbi:MAG: carboxypeptidase-like regulatory domain-containing protein [Flavobacteriaceae bacterium]|tara:strand:- start:9093 stop:9821 length:729 start_codon:yes stop_codon:yes gene_type:complete
MNKFLIFFLLSFSFITFSQEKRVILRGKLMYRNSNVIAANVINNSNQNNTITDTNGEFEILAGVGDEIIFSSVEFKIRTVRITKEIIKKNRLVVEVNEKLNFLDEVVISPENTEKFLDLKEEEFKKVDYLDDKSTAVENEIIRQNQLYRGINIVNIAKLLAKVISESKMEQEIKLTPSKALPLVFDNNFFINDLGLKDFEIITFLELMDNKQKIKSLLKKNKEFELIEYLFNESKKFKNSSR